MDERKTYYIEIERKYTFVDFIATICIFFLVLSSVFPKITTYGNNALICFFCEVAWLIIAFSQSPNTIFAILKKYWYTFVYMFYVAFVPYVFDNSAIGNRYIYSFGLIFGFYIFLYYLNSKRMFILRNVIFVAIPFFAYTFFKTFSVSLVNPWVIRSVNNADSVEILRQGIGGYHFIYFLVLLFSGFCFFSLNSKQNSPKKYLTVAVAILILTLVVLSNFFTALTLCFVGVLVSVIYRMKHNPLQLILITFLLLLLYFAAVDLKNLVLGMITSEGRMFNVIGNNDGSMIQILVDEFFRDRWPMNKISVESFLKHPFFGLITDAIENDGQYDISYGQHSFVLDTFALYGAGIGILNIFNLFKSLNVYSDEKIKDFKIVMTVTLLLVTCFNNITHSVAFGSSLIIPTIIYMLYYPKDYIKLTMNDVRQ